MTPEQRAEQHAQRRAEQLDDIASFQSDRRRAREAWWAATSCRVILPSDCDVFSATSALRKLPPNLPIKGGHYNARHRNYEVRLYLAGKQRSIARLPAARLIDVARLADMVRWFFWHRRTKRPGDASDSDFNFGLSSAISDCAHFTGITEKLRVLEKRLFGTQQ